MNLFLWKDEQDQCKNKYKLNPHQIVLWISGDLHFLNVETTVYGLAYLIFSLTMAEDKQQRTRVYILALKQQVNWGHI